MIENITLGKLQRTCCTVTEQKLIIRAFLNRLFSSVCSIRMFVVTISSIVRHIIYMSVVPIFFTYLLAAVIASNKIICEIVYLVKICLICLY